MKSRKRTKDYQFELCPKCRGIALHFTDEMRPLEDELDLIGSLCEGLGDLERVDESIVEGIGTAIRNYLDRQLILQHFFFGRQLPSRSFGPCFLKGELVRLRTIWIPKKEPAKGG